MHESESTSHEDVAGFYRRHVVMVRRRAQRLLGDAEAAQRVTQDAFLKVLEHRPYEGSAEQLAAYLYRTTTNLALGRLREEARQKELLAMRAKAVPPKRVAERDEAALRLREVLALVSYDEAQVAAYYYGDALEADEIADLLAIEKRTVLRRLACFDERAQRLLSMTLRVRDVA